MPKDPNIKKVLVIGSGPIIIGQAAEFDYAGTQACRSLREEGVSVVLVNSNPATIMTDPETADAVYIEPLTVEFVERIIAKEKPDGLLPTLGGQTGLNLATQLAEAGITDKYGVKLLGTPLTSIQKAEDREIFRALMREIGEPVPESWIIEDDASLEELSRNDDAPWPLIVRPAYTLGGTGGGIARTSEQLIEIGTRGLKLSPRHQIMVERYLAGWKEIEYEVMRDGADTCITVCNMENFDPMGMHTGDSIVVAPSQTLSDKEYQMLRTASLKIIRALGIEGGCNVQLALDPHSFGYYIIEVNPRVSRSSALASKATGYPIARVAAKIAVGLRLDEIPNAVTQKTLACFEPALDYIIVKIPRWPFDKFSQADRRITTQMKATGEVMAIDRSFEGALLKAIRSLEIGQIGLRLKGGDRLSDMELESGLASATDQRLFLIAEAFHRGLLVGEVADLSGVDPWFLFKIQRLVQFEDELRKNAPLFQTMASSFAPTPASPPLPRAAGEGPVSVPKASVRVAGESVASPSPAARGRGGEAGVGANEDALALLAQAKNKGFADRHLSEIWGVKEKQVRAWTKELELTPSYKMVDTCAAEFEAATPYFYSCREENSEA